MTLILTREDAEREAANKVKRLADVALPRLPSWNYDGVCSQHRLAGETRPVVDCDYQACGGDLWAKQRVGVTWMYLRRKGLLADDPGFGKWVQMMFLFSLLRHRNELPRRALFVVQTPSVLQCVEQAQRWVPGISLQYATGRMSKDKRYSRYCSTWDLLIVGAHIARNDRKQLELLGPFSLFFCDDVDEILDTRNVTHKAVISLAKMSDRSIVGNATNLQTRIEQLHAASLAAGGEAIFGNAWQFEKRYVKREKVRIYVRGVKRDITKVTGYQHLSEFRDRILPMYLRRRLEELEDANLPVLLPPNNVYLAMSKPQTMLYDKLRSGALKLKKADGTTYSAAKTAFMSGQRICAGIPAINGKDGVGASPKLDWLMNRVTNAWSDRKALAYMVNRGMVEATMARCRDQGVGYAVVWGEQSAEERAAEVERFRTDPDCRLLIGSKSVERSLNLQAANILVCVDTQLNPARMRQLLGRIRRAGSRYGHVAMYTLLMSNTQEEGYLEVLKRRAALSDYVFSEDAGAEIYGALSTYELLELITG